MVMIMVDCVLYGVKFEPEEAVEHRAYNAREHNQEAALRYGLIQETVV
jgi:hypothetical protein